MTVRLAGWVLLRFRFRLLDSIVLVSGGVQRESLHEEADKECEPGYANKD